MKHGIGNLGRDIVNVKFYFKFNQWVLLGTESFRVVRGMLHWDYVENKCGH